MIDFSKYKNKKVLITGGAGFIGKNLVQKLHEIGAKNIILDRETKEAENDSLKNISDSIVLGDLREEAVVQKLVTGVDYIFHLGGLSGAAESNERAVLDLEINGKGLLNILEACRKNNPNVRILFPSSQLVYGKVGESPVNEDYKTEPTSIYGVHKLLCEKYCRLYHELFNLKTVVLRIPNPYGPGQRAGQKYGIVNYFINQVRDGSPINIYGDGSQCRDYLYIDDLVEVMLVANSVDKAVGEIYNVGGPESYSLREMAETIIREFKTGEICYVPWPKDSARAEVGDIFLDKKKIKTELGWQPATNLETGIRKVVEITKGK